MRRSQLCINCCTSIENENPLGNALERDMYIMKTIRIVILIMRMTMEIYLLF